MSVFKVGQVVWHESYKRYMRVHSIVYEGLSKTHHSYIVPAWNTPGTIQVHADKMRALTAEEFGEPVEYPSSPPLGVVHERVDAIATFDSVAQGPSSPQVTPPKYDPSWHGSQAHTFVTDKPVGSEVKPRTPTEELLPTCLHGIPFIYSCPKCRKEFGSGNKRMAAKLRPEVKPRTGDKS